VGKRLFIAVDIDEATRAQVGGISAQLREAIGKQTKASWVRPDRMHLTLLFLGDAAAAFEQRVRRALTEPIRIAPFDMTFEGLGLFPERGSPRVLWLGIRDGLDSLRRIEKALIDDLHVERGHQGPFTPHLTLARFRDPVTRDALAGIARIPASAGPSRIDRVTLYDSRRSPAGPAYVPLAEAPLTGSG
jgi:RNA 2',3'-cyclic 3'-phosphodiesterase